MLQGDTNGDRVADFVIDLTGNLTISGPDLIGIVIAPVVIKSAGSISLTQVGSNFYLYNGGSGPSMKFGGTTFVAG